MYVNSELELGTSAKMLSVALTVPELTQQLLADSCMPTRHSLAHLRVGFAFCAQWRMMYLGCDGLRSGLCARRVACARVASVGLLGKTCTLTLRTFVTHDGSEQMVLPFRALDPNQNICLDML